MKNTSSTFLTRVRMARILFLFSVCFLSLHSYAANIGAYAQQKNLTIEMRNKTVKEVLDYIEKNSEFIFFYYSKAIDTKRIVSLSVKDQPITVILDQLFKNTDVLYEIKDRQISLKREELPTEQRPQDSKQQKRKLVGTVTDASSSDPLVGVSISVKNSPGTGTITDLDGKFSIEVSNNTELTFSYIGYKQQVLSVGDLGVLKVKMQSDNEVLDEVVVVGYGTMKKTDVTGSLASVSADKLAARGALRVEDALQGSVPGVNITATNSRANGKFSMQIRGQSSINNSNGPLYVVDGMVVSSIDFLNSEDIERIDVLKDASSTAIYGSRASEGVILITTKGAGAGQSKAQPVEITYDGYYGIRKVARMPKFMESTEWMNYRFAKYTTSSGPDETGHIKYIIKDADLQSVFQNGTEWKESPLYARWMNNESYDWADQVLQTGSQQNHFISASGASEKTSYRLGAGYQGEENVFKKTAMTASTSKLLSTSWVTPQRRWKSLLSSSASSRASAARARPGWPIRC